jgi:hypothetical protein
MNPINKRLFRVKLSASFFLHLIAIILLIVIRVQFGSFLEQESTNFSIHLFGIEFNSLLIVLDMILILTIIFGIISLFAGLIIVLVKYILYCILFLALFWPPSWFMLNINVSMVFISLSINLIWLILALILFISLHYLFEFFIDWKEGGAEGGTEIQTYSEGQKTFFIWNKLG